MRCFATAHDTHEGGPVPPQGPSLRQKCRSPQLFCKRLHYYCVSLSLVSFRHHIVTGFDLNPDGTCRARRRHLPLFSNPIPKFATSVKLPHRRVRPARRGHPAASNSRQSRNRSVSRAPYSRPAGDLNSADPHNLLIPATGRASSACAAAFRFSMSSPMRSRRNSRKSVTRTMPPTGALH